MELTDFKAAGQFAAHAGRKTVTVRDFDILRNVLPVLTIDSSSSRTPEFLTEEDSRCNGGVQTRWSCLHATV